MDKPQKHPIKAIIFDCFGEFYIDPFRHFIEAAPSEIQRELRDLMLQNNLGHIGREDIIDRYTALSGLPRNTVEARLYGVRMVRDTALLEFTQTLRPRYQLGLLSNLRAGSLNTYFTQQEQTDYFDAIVLSGEVGYVKPQPEIYHIICKRLQITPDEAVFIDDTPINCDGARQVGMQAIHYENLSALRHELSEVLQGNA